MELELLELELELDEDDELLDELLLVDELLLDELLLEDELLLDELPEDDVSPPPQAASIALNIPITIILRIIVVAPHMTPANRALIPSLTATVGRFR